MIIEETYIRLNASENGYVGQSRYLSVSGVSKFISYLMELLAQELIFNEKI